MKIAYQILNTDPIDQAPTKAQAQAVVVRQSTLEPTSVRYTFKDQSVLVIHYDGRMQAFESGLAHARYQRRNRNEQAN